MGIHLLENVFALNVLWKWECFYNIGYQLLSRQQGGGKGQSGVSRGHCLSLDSRVQRGFHGNAKLCLPREWGGQAGPWQLCDYSPEHASGSGLCFLIFKSWGQVNGGRPLLWALAYTEKSAARSSGLWLYYEIRETNFDSLKISVANRGLWLGSRWKAGKTKFRLEITVILDNSLS